MKTQNLSKINNDKTPKQFMNLIMYLSQET